jgi:hypothetical protein
MYKITWNTKTDKYAVVFVLVPDVHTLYVVYATLMESSLVDTIVVTNLEGDVIAMQDGMSINADKGTSSTIQRGK